MFFILSGYLYNPEKFVTCGIFIKRKFKGLIIPYLIFGILTYLYWLLIESRFRGTNLSAGQQLLGLFYGSRYKDFLEFNGPLWFIPCLFSMEVLFFFIEKLKRPLMVFLVCVVLFIFGVIFKNLCPWLPFGICAANIGMIFYGSGFMLRLTIPKIETWKVWITKNKLLVITGVIMLLIAQVFASPYSNANLARLETGNPIIYIGLAYMGFFICWLISVLIGKSKIMEWLGLNSLVVFALHGPIYRVLVSVTSFVIKMDMVVVRQNVLICLAITIATIVISVPFILLWNKWGKPLTK
ncbi:MAG: acyltransferase family protein [Bacteroidales bacterium]|nr:acyltransferase family protein [Bacteroidales bacterium]